MGSTPKFFVVLFTIILYFTSLFFAKPAFAQWGADTTDPIITISACGNTNVSNGSTVNCSQSSASISITFTDNQVNDSGLQTTSTSPTTTCAPTLSTDPASPTKTQTCTTSLSNSTSSHTITASATDWKNNPTSSVSFTLNFTYSISGSIYIDTNGDGSLAAGETTKYTGSCTVSVGSGTPSCSNGDYTISGLAPNTTYNVTLSGIASGYTITTTNPLSVALATANVTGKNFGVVQFYSISGVVFVDYDHDATKNGTDIFSAQTIDLSGAKTASTTSTGGSYSFTNLVAGTYTVSLAIPANYQATLPTTNCVPTTCMSPGTTSYSITISSSDITGRDFGISPLYSIEGSIYEDTNGNDTYDSGATGDPFFDGGIVLSCSGPTVCTPTVTAGTHTYRTGAILLSGDYTITATTPAGYKTVTPASIDVTVGPSATGKDFLVIGYKITGNVFVDNNHDGIWQTTGDSVESAYTSLASPTIDISPATVSYPENGVFKAVNLTSRQYWVTIYIPSGYKLTTRNISPAIPDDGSCYDPSTTPDWTLLGSPGYDFCYGGKAYQTTFTITATTGDMAIDFGITQLYTISGNIYEDKNGTEAYDSTPAPADALFANPPDYTKSIVLTLSGASTATTTTGAYSFTNLVSGSYSITATTPAGYKTVIYIGQSPSYDGTPTQPLDVAANIAGINFLVQGFTISGIVFKDYNHDGVKDASDVASPSAKVALSNLLANGSFEAWKDGYGNSDNVICNRDSPECNAAPDNWTPEGTLYRMYAGTGRSGSGYSVERNGQAFYQNVAVKPHTDYMLNGWVKPYTLYWRVNYGEPVQWDINREDLLAKLCAKTTSGTDINCITTQGASGDPWIQLQTTIFNSGANSTIRIWAYTNMQQTTLWDDFVLSEVVATSATGAYSFTDITAGTYTVRLIDDNPGYTSQYPGSLANPYTLTISTLDAAHDFSTTPLYTVSGYIYRDVDGNGAYTSGTDTAFSTGKTNAIHLKDTSGTEIAASSPVNSDATGYYAFANILSGSYNVSVDLPTGFKQVIALVTQPITVDNTTGNRNNINFLVQGFTISGNVFVDYDHNGAKDASDINYSGATLSITDTCPGQKTTDASGNYIFVNLTTGAYSVKLCVPSNYQATTTNPVSVAISTLDATADFGITPLYQITGYVYKDTNKNEYKNAGEDIYTGDITITATDPLGANVGSVVISNGTFIITGLLANTDAITSYTIAYSGVPSGYELTYPKPPSYVVKVGKNVTGYACGTDPEETTSGQDMNASCDANGNISDLGFGITDSIVWEQCIGGDCVSPPGIVIPVPQSPPPAPAACGTQLYAAIEGYNNLSPGIFFSGDQQFRFCKGGTCQDRSSSTGWVVGGSADPEDYQYQNPNTLRSSYDYMLTTARQSGITPKPLTDTQCGGSGLANCNLSTTNLDNGVYQADGNLTLSSSSNCPASTSRGTQPCYQFPNNKQYIILVNGDLTINENILVPTSSTVTFAVKGDIIVDKTIGTTHSIYCNPASTAHDGCNLEGYYSADKSFIIQGNSSGTSSVCAISGASDLRFNIAGSIVAGANLSGGGSINNQRDLCGLNLQCPAFTVTARPDFLLNAPDFIRHPNYIWKEEAP